MRVQSEQGRNWQGHQGQGLGLIQRGRKAAQPFEPARETGAGFFASGQTTITPAGLLSRSRGRVARNVAVRVGLRTDERRTTNDERRTTVG
jgi:hypothetical protein